jgi:ATP-dependent phosphofructokinase / diphosphate-dependent phosphofructokinase
MGTIKGNAVVFTQGGPTAVINASWVGVVQGLVDAPEVTGIYGAINGIDGILKQNFVDLAAQSVATLQAISQTPATALRSTRGSG